MQRYRYLIPCLLIVLIGLGLPRYSLGNSSLGGGQSYQAIQIALDSWAPYYQPQVAVAYADTPVTWFNSTSSPHAIRHDGCLTDGPCLFSSVAIPPDSAFVIAPLPPGRYPYHCELHPIMRGTLVVLDVPASLGGMAAVTEGGR